MNFQQFFVIKHRPENRQSFKKVHIIRQFFGIFGNGKFSSICKTEFNFYFSGFIEDIATIFCKVFDFFSGQQFKSLIDRWFSASVFSINKKIFSVNKKIYSLQALFCLSWSVCRMLPMVQPPSDCPVFYHSFFCSAYNFNNLYGSPMDKTAKNRFILIAI